MSNELKTKSFWERPEGTTGMLAIGFGLVAAYFSIDFLTTLFGKIINLLGQGIAITVLGAVLFGLIMIITNSKFQTLIAYGFKSVMRKITGAFVEIDPIGIMKSYIDDLKSKRGVMEESIGKLRGQIAVCQRQVTENDREYEKQMSTAKVARDRGNTSALTLANRQAGRLEKLNNESLKPILVTMEVHLRALAKYYEVTGTVIEDLHNEVNAQQIQRNMILQSHSAMSTAKKILMGGTDQKELFDQAMEFVVNDYGMKLGEIENFIENSKGFVESLDLQNAAFDEAAMKKLKEWENNVDSVLLGPQQKQQMLEQNVADTAMFNNIGAPAAQFDFAQLLDKNQK